MSDPERIRVLPDPLIDQIAAGEVVERPASVVKELLENALDAGATRIAIDVEQGGKRRIRVSDNGCGMHPDDLPLAVTRHATSKIRSLDDLTRSCATLGFRGEALPSIASVSRLTVTSTPTGAPEGCELHLAGGAAPRIRAAAPSPGTTVEAADLFYNTPARAKYLKGDATEWGHIVETVTDVALGAPQVHFILTHNGRAARTLPATADPAERVRQIYGREVTEQLIPLEVAHAEGGLALSGLISRPGFTRSGREHQKLLVNGRCIRNATLSHAIYAAYETALPAGRHPLFFLGLRVDPDQVDVNVHPAKREVRLAESNRVHHFVRDAVRETLGTFRGNTLRLTRMPAAAEDTHSTSTPRSWEERIRGAALRSVVHAREPGAPTLFAPPRAAVPAGMETRPGDSAARATEHRPAPELSEGAYRVVGQIHNTFLVVEAGEQTRIIDQHTAHERVLYERLLARVEETGIPGQRLLIPRDITLPPRDGARILAHQETLARLGLEIEPFGDDAFLIRALPEPLARADPEALVADIADDLAHLGEAEDAVKAALHRVLATIACHAAVKAGDRLAEPAMRQLVADLEQVANPHTCPHGRVVTAVLDRSQIKALFDRTWGA